MGINKELNEEELKNYIGGVKYEDLPSKFKHKSQEKELTENDLETVLAGIKNENQPEWAFNGDTEFNEDDNFTIEDDGTIVRK